MDIVIETDLGRDPDDFFAICYLASAGAKIRAIVISPGDPDQVAVAKFLLDELEIDAPVGASRSLDHDMFKSSNKFHMDILDRYRAAKRAAPDGVGADIMMRTFSKYPNAELFIIGPPKNTKQYLKAGGDFTKVTMQGGFVGYDVHGRQVERLHKFEGKFSVPSFNPNGDPEGMKMILDAFGCRRRFVGKNVCHTILYDHLTHEQCLGYKVKHRGGNLLRECMGEYLKKNGGKLFHDPTAAVCLLHPQIGTWVSGKMVRDGNAWGTKIVERGDQMLIDIDRKSLWHHLFTGE